MSHPHRVAELPALVYRLHGLESLSQHGWRSILADGSRGSHHSQHDDWGVLQTTLLLRSGALLKVHLPWVSQSWTHRWGQLP